MLKFFFSILLLHLGLGLSTNYGQDSPSVQFDQLPANYQLFGRNPDNNADINISGKVQSAGYTNISVVKFRNNTKVGYQKAALKYNEPNNAPFSFSTKIKSELAEYSFAVYLSKSSGDSVLAVRRDNVVAGDFYIVYGQSNAVSWEVEYPYRNEFCRTYGFFGWSLSNETGPRVGIFGIEFQRAIAEKQQIPTCVMNGAAAGTSIGQLIDVNPNDHADPSTRYGYLLNTAKQTGLVPYIKGMFYWQGETEANSDTPEIWAPQFAQLISLWKQDYPATQKIYLFQLPMGGGGPYDDRIGLFREQQRTMDRKFPIVQPYAPIGATGWNGFHYGLEGSLQIGRELADMAAFNHYGAKEKITSPSFQKAFYSTPARDEITMVFEDYQVMVYPKDSTYQNIEGSQEPFSTYKVKDFFYLNGVWQKLESGRAEDNKIIVKLKSVQYDTLIKYLPSKYHYAGLLTAPWVYLGPFLQNTRGFRAFAFHHNKISPYKNLGTLTLTAKQTNFIVLDWNKLPDATGYTLERYESGKLLETHQIYHLPASQSEFVDSTAASNVPYTYQIRATTAETESQVTRITATKTITGIATEETKLIEIYPNPVSDHITISSPTNKIERIEAFSMDGRKLKTLNANGLNTLDINVRDWSNGEYILKIHSKKETTSRKIVVMK